MDTFGVQTGVCLCSRDALWNCSAFAKRKWCHSFNASLWAFCHCGGSKIKLEYHSSSYHCKASCISFWVRVCASFWTRPCKLLCCICQCNDLTILYFIHSRHCRSCTSSVVRDDSLYLYCSILFFLICNSLYEISASYRSTAYCYFKPHVICTPLDLINLQVFRCQTTIWIWGMP